MNIIDTLAKPRVLGVLLAVSVALNLLLIGSVAGRYSARLMHPPMMGGGFEAGLRFLPEGQRKELRRQFHERMPEMRREQRALGSLHKELAFELSRAEPDRAAIEAKLRAIRDQVMKTQEALQASFIDTVLALPPEQRKPLIDEMLARRGPMMPPHRPHRRGGAAAPATPPPPPQPPPAPDE